MGLMARCAAPRTKVANETCVRSTIQTNDPSWHFSLRYSLKLSSLAGARRVGIRQALRELVTNI